MRIPDGSVLGDPKRLKFGMLTISTKPFFVGIVRAKFVHRTKSSVPSPSATWPCKWRGAPRLIRALDAAARAHAQFHCCAAHRAVASAALSSGHDRADVIRVIRERHGARLKSTMNCD